MRDTPRTDAESYYVTVNDGMGDELEECVVSARFAQVLENELARVTTENEKLLDLTKRLNTCLTDMRREHKLHGHITDASAEYGGRLRPLFEAIVNPGSKKHDT